MTLKETLEHRLAAWQDELETDKHGMAHLAERAIALIEDELRRLLIMAER